MVFTWIPALMKPEKAPERSEPLYMKAVRKATEEKKSQRRIFD